MTADQHPPKPKAGLTDELLAAHTERDQTQGPQTKQTFDSLNNTIEATKQLAATSSRRHDARRT